MIIINNFNTPIYQYRTKGVGVFVGFSGACVGGGWRGGGDFVVERDDADGIGVGGWGIDGDAWCGGYVVAGISGGVWGVECGQCGGGV